MGAINDDGDSEEALTLFEANLLRSEVTTHDENSQDCDYTVYSYRENDEYVTVCRDSNEEVSWVNRREAVVTEADRGDEFCRIPKNWERRCTIAGSMMVRHEIYWIPESTTHVWVQWGRHEGIVDACCRVKRVGRIVLEVTSEGLQQEALSANLPTIEDVDGGAGAAIRRIEANWTEFEESVQAELSEWAESMFWGAGRPEGQQVLDGWTIYWTLPRYPIYKVAKSFCEGDSYIAQSIVRTLVSLEVIRPRLTFEIFVR